MKHNIFSWLLFVVGVFSVPISAASENELVLQMQSGNAVLMIRHALAPGIGDPEEFDINDCSTQRNLDNAGREQAQAIGQWLRDHGIKNVKLFSSQWCRCMDTARLMGMG